MIFLITRIALQPPNAAAARKLLAQLGLTDWFKEASNEFGKKPETLELEIIDDDKSGMLTTSRKGMKYSLGMYCTADELEAFSKTLAALNIKTLQEAFIDRHAVPYLLETKRNHQYIIFDTRKVLGINLKFIVGNKSAAQVKQPNQTDA